MTPAPLLIIAPRHPERGNEVVEWLRQFSDGAAQRSAGEPITSSTRAYVADTLGEMGLWYILATVVVMGGTFQENMIHWTEQRHTLLSIGPHSEEYLKKLASHPAVTAYMDRNPNGMHTPVRHVLTFRYIINHDQGCLLSGQPAPPAWAAWIGWRD
jgi:hypothetical protein